jgi:hypothetical protein
LTTLRPITHAVIPSKARHQLPLEPDCNISVTANKSLRRIPIASYNLPVENCDQAPTAAPNFLPSPRCRATTCEPKPEVRTSANLSLSTACTLLKSPCLQPLDSQPLAHSLKNIGGYGVDQPFPFWERCPRLAIFPSSRPIVPSIAATLAKVRLRQEPLLVGHRAAPSKNEPNCPIQLSLAIKKQSIPNLPPIAGNERKANSVYKVFRKTVLFLRRIDR